MEKNKIGVKTKQLSLFYPTFCLFYFTTSRNLYFFCSDSFSIAHLPDINIYSLALSASNVAETVKIFCNHEMTVM